MCGLNKLLRSIQTALTQAWKPNARWVQQGRNLLSHLGWASYTGPVRSHSLDCRTVR